MTKKSKSGGVSWGDRLKALSVWIDEKLFPSKRRMKGNRSRAVQLGLLLIGRALGYDVSDIPESRILEALKENGWIVTVTAERVPGFNDSAR